MLAVSVSLAVPVAVAVAVAIALAVSVDVPLALAVLLAVVAAGASPERTNLGNTMLARLQTATWQGQRGGWRAWMLASLHTQAAFPGESTRTCPVRVGGWCDWK